MQAGSCSCINRCGTRKCPCKLNQIVCGNNCHPSRTCSNRQRGQHAVGEILVDEKENVKVNDEWVKIGETTLLHADLKIITGNQWLTDNIIFAAQQLLHQQHPYISGLQDPALQLTRTFDVQGSREFIQCLNMGKNHWITISTVGCPPSTVNIFDSLNLTLTMDAKKIIADLIHTSTESFIVQYVDMQYQMGGRDCGLFAIASACSICNSQEPVKVKYEQNSMRQHLADALTTQLLVPFPGKKRRVVSGFRKRERVKVYCICRLPNDGSLMVQCQACREWYHTKCVTIPKIYINSKLKWTCNNC